MATHSSILAWRIPWTEEPGGLPSMGLQRIRHNWGTNTSVWLFKTLIPTALSWRSFYTFRVRPFIRGSKVIWMHKIFSALVWGCASTVTRLISSNLSLQDDVLDRRWGPLPHRRGGHGWYSEKDFSTKEFTETYRYDMFSTLSKIWNSRVRQLERVALIFIHYRVENR